MSIKLQKGATGPYRRWDGVCSVCGEEDLGNNLKKILHHFRVLHPDIYDGGPPCWPDGKLVVLDTTLQPKDFT